MKPWLWLPTYTTYRLGPSAIHLWSLRYAREKIPERDPFQWRGLQFANRLGIAGGLDKNGDLLKTWWRLGAGFVEIGTVTPRAQKANRGNILERDNRNQALWNRLGFPSQGADRVCSRLKKAMPFTTPVFVNIGRNRETVNLEAHQDYVDLIEKFSDVADVFVINVSSPNTKGLRDLLKKENLAQFLDQVVPAAEKFEKPILLKLSPDTTDEALEGALEASLDSGIDGWILTNTTTSRPRRLDFPIDGGMSGRPLGPLSKEILQKSLKILGSRRKNRLVISCGGVMNPSDALERIDMGADLVQVYSGLIFYGPALFRTES